MVVIGLGKNLLLKSILGHCVRVLNFKNLLLEKIVTLSHIGNSDENLPENIKFNIKIRITVI